MRHVANKHLYKRKINNKIGNHRISRKSDSRVFCAQCGRDKFLFPTEKKALLACEHSENPQRAYYCSFCCGWHTTSMMDAEVFKKTATARRIRYAEKRLANPANLIKNSNIPQPIAFAGKRFGAGNLTTSCFEMLDFEGDAIVINANQNLKCETSEDRKIHVAAGADFTKKCLEIGQCAVGDAVICDGYNLKAKYIIQTVSPFYRKDKIDELGRCFHNALDLATTKNIRSLAIDTIGCGYCRFPAKISAIVAVVAIKHWLLDHNYYEINIILRANGEGYRRLLIDEILREELADAEE